MGCRRELGQGLNLQSKSYSARHESKGGREAMTGWRSDWGARTIAKTSRNVKENGIFSYSGGRKLLGPREVGQRRRSGHNEYFTR